MEEGKLRQRKIFKTNAYPYEDDLLGSEKISVDYRIRNSISYVALIIILVVLRYFFLFENSLPPQITIKEAKSKPGRFIGERAEMQLRTLTSLGSRVVGSYENEVLAVDYLKREISFIIQGAEKIHNIEMDIQKPTGSYYLEFRPHGFRNAYANIQNIVVKLSSYNCTNSVLLNCHYDTVPESPGASDNGLNCVVLLEILRVLSSGSEPLKNNVIFLFNGAEENPLQAAHGFLSQHKWRNEVKAVINLDSAGSGGKEILFQTTGEHWLIKAYGKSVPRPNAAVQAEELFRYGIIPSDTDFRLFRDFGNYSGLDLAHVFNGYVYHTKYDKMDFIQPGVYQFTGDNILALTKELIQSPELGKNHEKSKIVYFDVFQLFLVSYTHNISVIINLITVILSFWAVFKTFKSLSDSSILKSACHSLCGVTFSLILSAATLFTIAKTLDVFKSTMSWYLRSWLIIPMYVFPMVLSMLLVLQLVQVSSKGLLGHKVLRLINACQFLSTILLLIGTLLGIRSVFIFMLINLSASFGSLYVTCYKKKFTVKYYINIYACCLILPTLYGLYLAVRIFIVLIPMTARMGPQTNPEFLMASLVFIICSVFMWHLVPVLLLLKKVKHFLTVLGFLHFFVMFGVIFTNYGFPYNGDISTPALQRFYILHCDRTFYDVKGAVRRADSGFFVQSLDRNNLQYISEVIPVLRTAPRTSEDCINELFCGFPIFTSRFIRPAPYSAWIRASSPMIHHPTTLEVINQTQIKKNIRRVHLLISGPDHITVAMSPRPQVRLVRWSFDEFEPGESQSWNNRPTHMVYYSHGLIGGSLEFDIDLEINSTESKSVLDVAVVGHYMHDKKFRTKEFTNFLSQFPKWAHITPWTSTYKSWII